MTTAPTTEKNISLQVVRGLAASAVVVFHASYFSSQRSGAGWLADVFNGQFGFYGVMIFFVLSGFLMESAVRRYEPKAFLLHRFVRLYPTYWLVYLAVYLVQCLRLDGCEAFRWRAMTLFPDAHPAWPLAVEWTLSYEVFFYLVCTLVCFAPRVHLALLLAWLGIIAVTVFWFGHWGTSGFASVLEMPFSAWNLGFIFGGLAGHAKRLPRLPAPSALLLGGLALVLLGRLAAPVHDLFLVSSGLACMLLALVRVPRSDRPPGLATQSMFLVGECSYGLYLVHPMAIQIALQYVPASLIAQPVPLFAAMLGVALTAGLITGTLDVMLYRGLKTRVDRLVRGGRTDGAPIRAS